MQMFGVGALEMMVILIIAVIVVGPERLPQVAGDLARWISRARAYANHLTRDFNEVVQELEKEVGASRDDWKEISDEISSVARDVGSEVTETTKELEAASKELQSIDLEEVKRDPAPAAVKPAADANGNGATEVAADETPTDEASAEAGEAAENGEQPWYATGRSTRRRPRD